jgi:outer membrane protein TolC
VLAVLFEVKADYFDVVRRAKLIEVNKQAVARDQELLDFSNAKVEAKLATQRDVLSAEIILAQDRSKLLDAESRHDAALDRLSEALGLPFGCALQVRDIDVELQPRPISEGAWLAKVLRENPRLQRARLDLERLDVARHAAGNARLPALDLTVAYDEQRDNVTAAVRPDGLTRRAWQGGVTLSYPLFNKPLGNGYRQSLLEYEQGRRRLLDLERLVTLDLRNTVRNLQRIEDRISILRKNIEGARAKVEFAKVNFQLGRASNLDITDAQKDLLAAETDTVDELVNYRVELARLEQLLGGSIE